MGRFHISSSMFILESEALVEVFRFMIASMFALGAEKKLANKHVVSDGSSFN